MPQADDAAQTWTFAEPQDAKTRETTHEFQPVFTSDGLIPAIVSDHTSGVVLMFAWMNALALQRTVETGTAHFWSRSRNKLWRKGEESGNTLHVVEIRTDCDQDCLWLRVVPRGQGVACHTGAISCFYRAMDNIGVAGARDAPPALIAAPLPDRET